jgi:hypothetical protein
LIVISLILKRENITLIAIFGTGIVILFLFSKIYTQIEINGNEFKIVYYQWFCRVENKFDKSKINVKVNSKAVFKGGEIYLLNIIKENKTILEIDERDGFCLSDFEEIEKYFLK